VEKVSDLGAEEEEGRQCCLPFGLLVGILNSDIAFVKHGIAEQFVKVC